MTSPAATHYPIKDDLVSTGGRKLKKEKGEQERRP